MKTPEGRPQEEIIEAGERLAEGGQPLADALLEAVSRVRDVFWEMYRQEGMPYGETTDGLLRWWNEGYRLEKMVYEIHKIRTMQKSHLRESRAKRDSD